MMSRPRSGSTNIPTAHLPSTPGSVTVTLSPPPSRFSNRTSLPWPADAHMALDAAVAAAYGWDAETAEEEALRELRERNRSLGALQRGMESRFRRPRQRDSGSEDMR